MLINIDIISYFPNIHYDYLQHSFFKKLLEHNSIKLSMHSILEMSKKYSINNDDKPFGHNQGMLLSCTLVDKILLNIPYYNHQNTIIIHPSPSGYALSTEIVPQLNHYSNFIFICSRYEGLDARIIEKFNVFEICIGDYILFDGDVAAMVIYNSFIRDKFVKKTAKLNESFDNMLLEHDQFTQPKIYDKYIVPSVLREGNHKKISEWQYINSMQKTIKKRMDIYTKYINYKRIYTFNKPKTN